MFTRLTVLGCLWWRSVSEARPDAFALDLVFDNVTAGSGETQAPHRTVIVRGDRIVESGSMGT